LSQLGINHTNPNFIYYLGGTLEDRRRERGREKKT
jgi:hypothetical protein